MSFANLNVQKLEPTVVYPGTVIQRGQDFESSPGILHFSGFKINEENVQEVSVINCAKTVKRLQVLPLDSEVFKVIVY